MLSVICWYGSIMKKLMYDDFLIWSNLLCFDAGREVLHQWMEINALLDTLETLKLSFIMFSFLYFCKCYEIRSNSSDDWFLFFFFL
jgi:hypothetical protein